MKLFPFYRWLHHSLDKLTVNHSLNNTNNSSVVAGSTNTSNTGNNNTVTVNPSISNIKWKTKES
jgi:hypothetical protein